MNNGHQALTSIAALARAWGVSNKDKQVLRFLESRRIAPAHSQKFGRGTMRFYGAEEVIGLLPEFNKWHEKIEKKDRPTNAPPRFNNWNALNDNVRRIERKLDAILDALGVKGE